MIRAKIILSVFAVMVLMGCRSAESEKSPVTKNSISAHPNSTKKNDEQKDYGDGLSSEDADFLDSTVVVIKYDDMFNPDGTLKYK